MMDGQQRSMRIGLLVGWVVTVALLAGMIVWAVRRSSGPGEFITGAALVGLVVARGLGYSKLRRERARLR